MLIRVSLSISMYLHVYPYQHFYFSTIPLCSTSSNFI